MSAAKIKFIERELADLGWHKSDAVYTYVYERAVPAADVLTKRELTELIEDLIDLYSYINGGIRV